MSVLGVGWKNPSRGSPFGITRLAELHGKIKIFYPRVKSQLSLSDVQESNMLALLILAGSNRDICFVCLIDSLRPTNNLSVKQGRVFLG